MQVRAAKQALEQSAFLASHQQDEELRLVAESTARAKLRVQASVSWSKILYLVTNERGVWGSAPESIAAQRAWKLDAIEDPFRRVRRIIHDSRTYSYKKSDAPDTDAFDDESPEKLQSDWMQFIKNSLGFKLEVSATPSTRPQLRALETFEDADDTGNTAPLLGKVLVNVACEAVIPGYRVPGKLLVSHDALFFIVDERHRAYQRASKDQRDRFDALNGRWQGHDLQAVAYRRYMLAYTALELFFKNRTTMFINLYSTTTSRKVMKALPASDPGDVLYDLGPYLRSIVKPAQLIRRSSMTARWQNREISNFEYLMFLNTMASRSYNDLSQYLIFPWIIANYTSPTLDLTDLSNFRDLSKPIGVLSPERLATFLDRYNTWEEADTSIPKFHYGTHYSTPGYVLFWLVRLQPFTDLAVRLQSGKFDHPDRLFFSVGQEWSNCQSSTSDVRELIPQLFYCPVRRCTAPRHTDNRTQEMLQNINGYQFGQTHTGIEASFSSTALCADGSQVNDVELPAWARTVDEFVQIHSQALESDIVSRTLHKWIDLIFGYRQACPVPVIPPYSLTAAWRASCGRGQRVFPHDIRGQRECGRH